MAEHAADTPELAELADDFDIQAEIGRGGTAVVYVARERALDRRVAIKVIRGRYAADDELVARLEREARLVARLTHPNVVGLHSVRRLRHGSLALVMQYVPGHTLRDELRRRGPLSAPRARRVLVEVGRALAAAHAHGIVHRDVKPENIHLAHDTGRVLLGDFGSATPLDADNRLTIPGMTIGTPGYMAPELVDGGTATPAADLYSLGLVGWEMLAGQQPWTGSTLFEVLAFRKHGQLAPIAELRPDVPRALAAAVERATQAEPAQRWESAAALVAALGGGVAPVGVTTVPAQPIQLTGAPLRREDPPAVEPAVPTVRFVRPAPEELERSPYAPGAAATPALVVTPRPVAPPPDPPATLADTTPAADDDEPDEELWDDERLEPATRSPWRLWRRVAAAVVLGGGALTAVLAFGLRRSADLPATLQLGADAPPRRTVPLDDAVSPASVVTATPSATMPPPVTDSARVTQARLDSSSATPATATVDALSDVAAADSDTPPPAPTRVAATPPTARPPMVPAPRARPTPPDADVARERAGTVALAPERTPEPAPRPREAPIPPPPSTDAGDSEGSADAAAVAGALSARAVSLGGMHSCAVLRGGRVSCWGSNDHGQLGSRGGARQVRAAPLTVGLELHGLALGLAHSCGLMDDGTALCWGSNDHGQLGIGAATETSVPSRVSGDTRFTALAVGASHSCGLDADGAALCWGANDDGQLGTGDTRARRAPTRVAGDARFASIVAGWSHSCAVAAGGRGFCWGSNDDGQLGVAGSSRDTPTPVGTSERLRAMAAGSAHSCALTTGGSVLCWGRNRDGQLGDGTRSGSRTPHTVKLPGTAVAIAAGTVHSCALLRAGDVYCWGQNRYGQLGDGTTIDRATPVRVATSLPFAAIAASGAHSCGLTTGGATLCWGYNLDGQLGDGTRDNRSRPVPVRAGGTG
jgi:alpha-tubulin suppressor-like RCC1 family protein/tRNA A-37 threonylcarbamoyl transferase component Bud32